MSLESGEQNPPQEGLSMEQLAEILSGQERARKEAPPPSRESLSKENITHETASQEVKSAIQLLEKSGIPADTVFVRGSFVTGGGRFSDLKTEGADIDVLILTNVNPIEFIDLFNNTNSPFVAKREKMYKDSSLKEEIPGYIKITRRDNPTTGLDMLVYNQETFEWLAEDKDPRKIYDEGKLVQRTVAEGLLLKGETPRFMVRISHDAGYDRKIPTDYEFLV